MKAILITIIVLALECLGMHTLLQYMPWESAMRVIGLSMVVIAIIVAVVYLPPSEQTK